MAVRRMIGRHTAQMDSRGRISFPAAFRAAIGETLYLSPDLDRIGYLVARSEDEFNAEYDELEQAVREASQNIPGRTARERIEAQSKARWRMRQFTGRTVQLSPDGSGRITLPAELVTYAGLHGQVLVIGMGMSAEIWDEEVYRVAESAYESGEYEQTQGNP